MWVFRHRHPAGHAQCRGSIHNSSNLHVCQWDWILRCVLVYLSCVDMRAFHQCSTRTRHACGCACCRVVSRLPIANVAAVVSCYARAHPGMLQRFVPRFVDAPIAGAPAAACISMAPAKMKQKEPQALEEAATATSIGVGNIASIALQNEISDITERLSSDPQLAFTLGSLLREGTLVSMLKGATTTRTSRRSRRPQRTRGGGRAAFVAQRKP